MAMSTKGTILVTDSLFIFDEHIRRLEAAGYEVERLDKPKASEEELIAAVKGKVGYILGGIERVTDVVIDAADELRAISIPAIGYKTFLPGWEHTTKKGIAISYAPDGPTQEVSEWAITAALLMNRHFVKLGSAGDGKFSFEVTQGIESQRVGIIGLGRTGSRIAEMLRVFRPRSISYSSRTSHEDKEQILGVQYLDISQLLSESDIVFLCVSGEARGFFTADYIKLMKKGALLVSFMHPGVVDEEGLLSALQQDSIRAISDYPMTSRAFLDLPLDRWYSMNTSNTVTQAGAKLMSDIVTESIVNLLSTGNDPLLVNPEYRHYRDND